MSETYSVVVDIGYSFTHVVPFVEERPINHAIKRVNVGGKVASLRQNSQLEDCHIRS